MERRIELGKKLRTALGSNNVYFQSPESTKMAYPAIRYSLDDIETDNADNMKYSKKRRYSVTLMDYDPDSETVDKILTSFDYCSFDRFYISDKLNHWVFTLFY